MRTPPACLVTASRWTTRWIFLVLCFPAPMLGAQEAAVEVLSGARVVDVRQGVVLPESVVVVRDGRIESISPSPAGVPPGSRITRLEGAYLLPGLMNMHVHLGLILPGEEGARLANETEAEVALRIASNARRSLLSGTTTIRTTDDPRHADIALQKAIELGYEQGPRIFSSGEMVDITAGHWRRPPTHDGAAEMIRAVRGEIAAGASWIKIAISGGIATPGGGIAAALMTPDEIRAVIDTAHRLGRKVTAHSGSPLATNDAIDAGIDCIEHGYHLTREVLRRMRDTGTWYVPTIVVSRPATIPFYQRIGSPPWYLERVASVGENHWRALQMAIEEGVDIALGTDQFPAEPNDGTVATIREAEYYVEAGMTPLQALRSGTIQPARMLGAEEELGTLEAGKRADIVAVRSNPLEDISALRSLFFVMKDGRIFRNDPR